MSKYFVAIFFLFSLVTSCVEKVSDNDIGFIKESVNPIKTKKVVLVENYGNATVDLSYQVTILDFDSPLTSKEPGNTFIVDGNHGVAKMDTGSIIFHWLKKDTLLIQFGNHLRIFHQQNNVDGTTVLYSPKY